MKRLVPLKDFVLDVMAQPRVRTKGNVADEYAARMQAGDKFPPAVAFTDGEMTWLADGWHRYAAAMSIGAETLLCEVRRGDIRSAILYAVGANDTHGLKRSNADKRKAVLILLRDKEWSQWSDREIARRCRVGADLVGSIRATVVSDSEKKTKRRYRTKHGTEAVMDTTEIAKRTEYKGDLERTGSISNDLVAILQAVEKLPSPKEAAEKFRWADQYQPERFDSVAAWFCEFVEALRGAPDGQTAAAA